MGKHRYSDKDFSEAVRTSFSIRETMDKFGMVANGGAYVAFYSRVKRLNIDISHFTGQGHLKGKTHNWSKKKELSELLVSNSDKALGSSLKKRILKEGLLENKCAICGLQDSWNGQPIVLQIDHISGDHFDHRIENLRILCPNCHSQTPTFCSKNVKNKKSNPPKKIKPIFTPILPHNCSFCGILLKDGRSKNCKPCYNANQKVLQTPFKRTKIDWPTIIEIENKLKTMSYVALGKELGVSDNAIRKYIKRMKAEEDEKAAEQAKENGS